MAKQRTTKVAVALPEESAPGQWLRSLRLSGFSVVMLALITVMIVVLAPSLHTLVGQQQQLAQLRQAVKDKQDSVNNLTADIARWDDPAYIEAQARDRLVYVFPGDYTYLVIDDGGAAKTDDGAPISETLQTTKVDWVHALLETVVTAGVTTQTSAQLQSPVIQSPITPPVSP